MGEAKRRRELGPERIDVIHGAQRCAWCGERMSTMFTVDRRGSAQPTDPGAIVICHHCTGMNWTDETRRLVKLDAKLRTVFDLDDLTKLDAAVELLRSKKRGRGESW